MDQRQPSLATKTTRHGYQLFDRSDEVLTSRRYYLTNTYCVFAGRGLVKIAGLTPRLIKACTHCIAVRRLKGFFELQCVTRMPTIEP